MANIKILFYDPQNVNTIQVTTGNRGGIKFFIKEGNPGGKEVHSMIVLDIETAVRFSRELRRQIALLKDDLKSNDYAK